MMRWIYPLLGFVVVSSVISCSTAPPPNQIVPTATPKPLVSATPTPTPVALEPTPQVSAPTDNQVLQELTVYKSANDAPEILKTITKQLEDSKTTPDQMSRPDQIVYGNLLLASGRFAEAKALFEGLLAKNDQDRDALLALTLIAGAENQTARQKIYLDRLNMAFPNDWEIQNLEGQFAQAQGNSSAAQAAFEKSLKLLENSEALKGLAKLAQDKKAWDRALDYLNRASKLDIADDQVYAARSEVEIAKEQYFAAAKDIDKAISLQPDYTWHYLDRARLNWLHMYKPDEAVQDLEKVLNKDPDNFFAYEYLAEIEESQDRVKESYNHYLKAIALKPDYRFAYPAITILAFHFKDYEKAAQYAHEAGKDYPGEYAFPMIEALSFRFSAKPAQAKNVLVNAGSRFPPGSTVSEMFRFLQTPQASSFFNDTLAREKDNTLRARLKFYQACQYLVDKTPASAKAALEEVSQYKLRGIPEIRMAKAWLAGLE